jgi:hypothetical protein
MSEALIPAERIQSRILVLRDQRVLLDRDLAALYGVPTFRLNEAVKRNANRFPEDFRFQLTREEFARLRSQFAISKTKPAGKQEDAVNSSQSAMSSSRHRGAAYLPWAFTEHGALMAANVLNSPEAVAMSVQVVRAFVRLRQMLVNHKALAAKLAELDARVGAHDEQLATLVEAIRQLAAPPPAHGREMGFHTTLKLPKQ